MSDGLHIRWRETTPDRGLLAFALAEIDALHGTWPETVQCNIVIEKVSLEGEQVRALVELDLGRRSPTLRAKALRGDAYAALRDAFVDLRSHMPPYVGFASVEAHALEAAAEAAA